MEKANIYTHSDCEMLSGQKKTTLDRQKYPMIVFTHLFKKSKQQEYRGSHDETATIPPTNLHRKLPCSPCGCVRAACGALRGVRAETGSPPFTLFGHRPSLLRIVPSLETLFSSPSSQLSARARGVFLCIPFLLREVCGGSMNR